MTQKPTNARRPTSGLMAYMQLFRLPNVFTAMADVAMGYLFVHASLAPASVFGSLLAASCLLYTAGMVLNDVFDVKEDSHERPNRPLPQGRIAVGWARWLGFEMLLVGVALGWIAGYVFPAVETVGWRSGAVAVAIGVCVVAYNVGLKRTPLGPIVMGACRMLNVLLGMSVAPAALAGGSAWLWGYEGPQLVVAGGIGLYIVGVTWFAQTETGKSPRLNLAAATIVIVAGIVVLGLLPTLLPFPRLPGRLSAFTWRMLLVLLAVTISRRCLMAAYVPSPRNVQLAVKQCILSIIVLDAAVCLAVHEWYYAVGILALLAPAVVLGRWVYST